MATLGHIVTKTDTLERLSRFYKVPICMILRANEGGRGLLRPGGALPFRFPTTAWKRPRAGTRCLKNGAILCRRGIRFWHRSEIWNNHAKDFAG